MTTGYPAEHAHIMTMKLSPSLPEDQEGHHFLKFPKEPATQEIKNAV